MAFNFRKIIDNIDSKIESAVSSVTEYTKKEILPEIESAASNISDKVGGITESIKEKAEDLSDKTASRVKEWSSQGKAGNIPTRYQEIVKVALIASAAVGPLGVAAGIVKYYIGSKLATYAFFLIPGAGIFAGMSVSAICNIYFTYNFASILIQLMDTKPEYSDDDIITEIISLLKKLPTTEEIKEIVYIYSN